MGSKVVLKAIIDLAGKPEEAVLKALDEVEKRVGEEESFELVEVAKAEPELQEGGLYTAFLDLEIKCNSPRDAMKFIVEYLPTSIEIIEPSVLKVSSEELSDVLNDMARFQIRNVNENHKLKVYNYNLKKELEALKGKK